ncbi:MAG TPA: group 1 glycosyl transferase, partial [Flavisolibacter sp.]|nr:group 1 glycosyl transferase [Flavisolibacter sp.]
MIKICTTLQNAGYQVLLIGRGSRTSPPLSPQFFRQKRLPCLFQKGKLFYAEFNLRLFFYLLFLKMDLVCAIDL